MLYLPSYAGALRCIGQDLQRQNIDLFELKSRADEFCLQCGDPNPPYTDLIEIVFSKEKIQVIDREGRAQRGQSIGEIRFDSMPEILRAIGQYIDKKRGSLRWVSNGASSSDAVLQLEYQTRVGEVELETLTLSFIREACVRMYQKRAGVNEAINLLTRKR
jgi:hypothetical protein